MEKREVIELLQQERSVRILKYKRGVEVVCDLNVWIIGHMVMSFWFYVNVSGTHSWSWLFSQLLMLQAPWVIFHRVVYHPSVSTLMTASHFLAGNREAELKPTTFSFFLLLLVFCLSASYTPSNIVP